MSTALRHAGRVTDEGVLVLADPSAWRRAVARHRDRAVWVSVVRQQTARTLPQNRLYWLWCGEVGAYIGEPAKTVHEYFKQMFLSPREVELLEGQRLVMPPTTRTLTVEAFSEYMQQIQTWAAQFLGLALPEAGALEAVL